ncbi:MAG: response regulator, partial [bacterium]|nr:response regulator [bacterium]
VIGYLGIQQDVTERRKVEMALKESEGRFKEIFRNLGMGVAVYEAVDGCKDFIFKEINDAGAKINRISRENTIGKRLLSLFPGVKELGLFDVLVRVHKTGKPEHLPLEFYEDNRLNLWVDNYIFQLPSGDIVAVYNDLTAQKRAEEEKGLIVDQLYHAQKMESIGRLAGGIAHDFNNLLVGIMGYAELLKMQYPDKTSTEGEAAEVILNSAERASALTVQLLGFARKGKFNPVPLNINDILRNTVKVSEKIFEKNIKISFDLGTEVKLIEADLHQIEQVLTNLFINAKDAMPKGGILTLKTNNKKVETGINCLCGNSEPGEYVVVDVTDTGIGIPDEIVENIFEPFFTTKGEGKGTGLGLATVYGIITNHGGHLSVTSEPGKGTSIIISLPVSGKKVKAKKKDKKLIRGTGRILIIDDEKNVRQYTEAMLRRMGYEVILAEDGSEGVKIYKKNKDIIDLVLLDMIMPVKSGKETLAEMQKVKPDVRVVLFSGYSKEGQAEEIMKKGVKGFIQKPFSAEQLSKTVKKAIKA